ncbi:MAG: dihydropteroate synthase [Legionellales bacterium]
MSPEQFLSWMEAKSKPALQAIAEKPLIMGIVNVTADSFSDGGRFLSLKNACTQVVTLIEQGADLIDIGGESTKPGAIKVPLEIELARVIPVIEHLRKSSDIAVSIDTYKPEVMNAAVNAGANIINDVYALRSAGALAMAAKLAVPVCLMHMQGEPQNMQINPRYPHGVIAEVTQFFMERIAACKGMGISKSNLILDPGFGFGKRAQHNLQLMKQVNVFRQFNLPVLLGVSRKSTIGDILGLNIDQRLMGSIALAVYAMLHGVNIIRTHDVEQTNQALKMTDAILQIEEETDEST